jgi:hypothetical protein
MLQIKEIWENLFVYKIITKSSTCFLEFFKIEYFLSSVIIKLNIIFFKPFYLIEYTIISLIILYRLNSKSKK